MGQLAANVKRQFDRLAEEFVHGLNAVPFYANVPEQLKRSIAQTYLNLTIGGLETRDISPLAEFLQMRAREVLAQGFAADALLQALNVYEEIIWPLVDSADDARFLGLATSRLRDVVSREIAAQLVQSEREFRSLFERSPAGIFRSTLDGQIIQANPAFLRLFGYDSLDAINRVGLKALYQDPAAWDRLLDLLNKGPVSEQEIAFRGPGGQTTWLSLSAGLVSGPRGQFVEGMVQSIDERKLAEERARRRLAQLRAVTELTVQLSAERDADMLCKQAVELGRKYLDVDRLSIWLNDGSPGHFRGTWGTDEHGQTRDERAARMEVESDSGWWQMVTGALTEEVNYETLRDHLSHSVGEGWHISVPVVGERGNVLGVLVADQLLSQREWDDYIVEILRLYGFSIGRLLEGVTILEALARSQEMLRLIMDNIPQTVFWKDRNLTYLGCNRAYAAAKGLPNPEAVVGKTDYDFSPPDQAERFRADDLMVISSAQPRLNYEEPLITLTGEQRWLRTSKIPLQNAAGDVIAVLGMYEDITKRKEIEITLERLARAVEATRDAVIITDLKGNIVFVNPAFEQITGYSAAEALGQNPRILKSGMQDEAVYAQMWQTITAGRPWSGEMVNRRKDGTLYNAQLSISPILDRHGQVEQFVAIQRDVTEQRKIEQAVQEAQQMLRLIIDTIPEMIFWKDRNSVFMGCNKRFAQAAGFQEPEEIIGLTDYDMAWTREQSDAFVRDDREVMERATPKLHILEPQLQADGRRVWLETNKVPLFDKQGNVVGILGTAIDVTERVEALENARAAQQMLQAVIDNIPQTVFWKDRNLVFLGCNAAFARDAHLSSPAQIVGKTDYDLWWADMAEQFQADDRAVIESGEPILNQESVRVFENGRRGWSLQNKIPLRDQNGQIWAVLGTAENITERKLAETRLRENETRLTLALEAANAGVWEMRPQRDEVYLDARWFALLGYGANELPQAYETWAALLHPEEREAVETQIQNYIRQGADFELDFRMKAKSGDYRWIHSIAKVIERNPDGSAAHLVGTHTDITANIQRDRERIELYVRRTEEVRLSTQVAQEIAVAPSLDELFARVVTLIKERFGYYHTQIFRYDPEREAMVLVAGYGQVGAQMLAAGHYLPRGVGLVGMAAEIGQSVLATDVRSDPNWQPNPNLPETRGELAVPIRWREQVLGILDVQSDRAGELDQDDQLVLEGLCGQIAIAIQNTQAIQEAQTFRLLVENAGQGIGIATLDGRMYYANRALLEIVGESELNAFLGQPFLDYAAEHERRRLEEEILPRVMQGESFQGEMVVRSRSGRLVPTLHSLFALHDEQGHPRFLVDIITDITESKRIQAEMQERLQELNTLYRQISEQGWQVFREQGTLPGGYVYDGVEARPADQLWVPEIGEAVNTGHLVVTTFEKPVAVAPLAVPGGETVGVLGVFDDPASPLPPEDLELVELVAAEVAQALEGARLSVQTQAALAEASALYQASAALGAAQTFDQVLEVLRAHTEIGEADLNVSINLFNRPWVGDDVPEWSQVLARWTRLEASATLPRYPLRAFPSASRLLRPDQPTIIEDVWTDQRMDEIARNLYGKQFRSRSTFFVPLVVGGSWIGYVNAIFSQPRKFTPESLRRITVLVGQAAVVIQSIQRLQETQARARREQQLREITARLRNQSNVEGVLRTLARELGQVWGRRTFVSVSSLEALEAAIGTQPTTSGDDGRSRGGAEEVE